MKHKLLAILPIFLLSLLTERAFADASFEGTQNGLVRTSFDLYGGYSSDIAVDGSGKVYAAFNSPNGIYCLENGSTEWNDPAAGTDMGNIQAIALGGSNGTAFIIGGISLFRTTDGCANWTELAGSSGESITNNFGFHLAYGHNTLLVDTRDGSLDRSSNNGDSFTKITVVSGAESTASIAASPTSGEFYVLTKKNGTYTLFRSVDSGVTWNDTGKSGDFADVAVDSTNANRIAICTNSGAVEYSSNGGSTWSTLTPPPTSKNTVRFINGRLFKGNEYSDDLTTWTLLGKTNSGANVLSPIAGSPTDTSLIYAASELGIAKSTDNTASFNDLNTGIYSVTVEDIAQGTDKNIVYLATGQGLAKTSNYLNAAGPNWKFPVQINPTTPYIEVNSITIDASDSNRLYAGLFNGEIYYSTDAGNSWTASTVAQISSADFSDIKQTADGTLYASYRLRGSNTGGVLRSQDRGVTWSLISNGTFSIDSNTLGVIGNTVYVGTGDDQDSANPGNGIYAFDGTNWTKLSGAVSGKLILAIVSIGDTLLAASAPDSGVAGGVFRSTNAGKTWTEVTSKGLRANDGWYRTLAVDPKNTDIVYVAHGRPAGTAEMYYSQDKGYTWALLYTGLTDEVPQSMLVDGLTIGSAVGFTGVALKNNVKVLSKILKNKLKSTQSKTISCTLKSGTTALPNQQVSLEVKNGKKFKRLQTKKTSKKGTQTFSLAKVKRGSKVRCLFLEAASGQKKI